MRINRPCRLLFLSLAALLAFAYPSEAQTHHPDYRDGFLYIKIEKARLLELNRATYEEWTSRGNDNLPNHLPELEATLANYSVTEFSAASRLKSERLAPWYKVLFTDVAETEAIMRDLRSLDFVEIVERRALQRMSQLPDDYFPVRWHLPQVRAARAWEVSRGSPEIVVAIVDDAVLTTHDDLAPDIWENPGEIPGNGVDDDQNGYIDDVSGWDVSDRDNDPRPPSRATNWSWTHGTHCAGIASAATDNGRGISSIGFNTKIMPVKAKPSGEDGPFINDGYEGVEYAIAAGADVISMSWGGGGRNAFAQEIMNEANDRGIVLVAAAGNDNSEEAQFPAAYDHVIAVGATNRNDNRAGFSNYGTWVDVMAPGVQITSTVAGSNSSYAGQSGTSMACPLVAGLVSLMRSFNPEMTPEETLDCLTNSCVNIDARHNSSFAGKLGAGRIDAENALLCVEPVVFDYDASVSLIRSPSEFSCSQQIVPSFDLFNAGSTPLRAVQIYYRYNEGETNLLEWQGFIDSAGVQTLDLPLIAASPGLNRLEIWSRNPNGMDDEFPGNDTAFVEFQILPQTLQIPFREDFENGGFTNQNWLVQNSDDDLTWEVADAPNENPGNKAARVNNFEYTSSGMRDGLITPPLDFSNYENIELTFRHAYRRVSADFADSLIILVSTDCGQTFERVFANGGGQGFATGTIIGNRNFVPSGREDWCDNEWQDCFAVDLSDYAGQTVIIKFENYNAYGNNIYIDDINIEGEFVEEAEPEAAFSALRTEICPGGSVSFSNRSINAAGARLNWSFPGGEPATSSDPYPIVVYNEPGTYPVSLTATTDNGSDVLEIQDYIVVREAPSAQFNRENPTLCSGSRILIEATGAVSYLWAPETGLNATAGPTVMASPENTTTYTVTAYDEFGCVGASEITVTVEDEAGNLSISTPKEVFCKGETATLSAPEEVSDVSWRFNGQPLEMENSSVEFLADRTTTVELYGLTASGCYDYETRTLEVIDVALELNSNDVSFCEGRSARLNASGAENYLWTPSDGLNFDDRASVEATPESATTYTVIGSTADCADTAEVVVTPIAFDVSFTASAYRVGLNNGGEVRFEDNLGGTAFRLWNFGDGSTSNQPDPTHRYTEEGEYTVTLQATELPCSGSYDTVIVVVQEVSRQELDNSAFAVYPNPAKTTVKIAALNGNSGPATAELFALDGRMVKKSELSGFESGTVVEISLAGIPAGVYLLNVSQDGATYHHKLVIE